ncbi:MAG: tetratricopeptide repeat protein [Alphaproteobacteria bacterium]
MAISDKLWKRVAVGLAIASIAWFLFDGLIAQRDPALDAQSAADRAFEDGDYGRALNLYTDRVALEPTNPFALRGVAQSLLQLGRLGEALTAFAAAIAAEPDFGGTYANRGILHDRLGSYELAIADYARAMELDPEIAEGPHWMTRFLRNQSDAPPTIADRLGYLRAELAKPEDERVLRVPEEDAEQRPYQQ